MRAFLIDDDDGASNSAEVFSTEELKFEFMKPGPLEVFAKTIFDAKPCLVIVDYRLDERVGVNDQAVSYKASTLAQHLRDLASESGNEDFPIVLHSAEEKIREHFRPEKTAHDLFDHIIKKAARKNSEDERRRLGALAAGYSDLLARRPYKDHLPELFGLDRDRLHLIDHQEIVDLAAATAVPHVFARFLLKRIVNRNGILVDRRTVLARCGVSVECAGTNILLDELQKVHANYTGVFGQFRSMWWRRVVEETLEEWFGAVVNSLSARERAGILSGRFGYPFEPAVSAWNKSSDERFSHVCSICKRPTLISQSVAVHEQYVGALSDRRRICFNCIQDDRHIDRVDLRVDALDKPVEMEVRKGTIKGE